MLTVHADQARLTDFGSGYLSNQKCLIVYSWTLGVSAICVKIFQNWNIWKVIWLKSWQQGYPSLSNRNLLQQILSWPKRPLQNILILLRINFKIYFPNIAKCIIMKWICMTFSTFCVDFPTFEFWIFLKLFLEYIEENGHLDFKTSNDLRW